MVDPRRRSRLLDRPGGSFRRGRGVLCDTVWEPHRPCPDPRASVLTPTTSGTSSDDTTPALLHDRSARAVRVPPADPKAIEVPAARSRRRDDAHPCGVDVVVNADTGRTGVRIDCRCGIHSAPHSSIGAGPRVHEDRPLKTAPARTTPIGRFVPIWMPHLIHLVRRADQASDATSTAAPPRTVPPPGTPAPRTIARRHLLLGTGGVAALGLTLGATTDAGADADAAAGAMTVWRLDADWGAPRGPHGKTELHSRASRAAARHRYALTDRDALAMNLHKCSFAPAVPLSVDRVAFTHLWEPLAYEWRNPWNGRTVRIFDDRHASRIPDGAATLALALATRRSTPSGTPSGASPPDGSPAATPPSPTSRPHQQRRWRRPRRVGPTRQSPDPGHDRRQSPTLLATGLAALTAGLLALRTRTHTQRTPAATGTERPGPGQLDSRATLGPRRFCRRSR